MWDHPSGAGNGLGTLSAFREAECALRVDLCKELDEGKSVAIFHAAGKGCRLYPLPLIESSKSHIKLPSTKGSSSSYFETVLSAVIRQTSAFSSVLKGRLSVFWGDQLFFPKKQLVKPSKDIAIFSLKQEHLPPSDTWEEDGWHGYGLLGRDHSGSVRQFEKISSNTFVNCLPLFESGFYKSLGCFSLSKRCLKALLEDFSEEIQAKKAHLDSDPDFWMALSHIKKHYLSFFPGKEQHFNRLAKFHDSMSLEALDIGPKSHFFDFGNLKAFYHNMLSILDEKKPLQHFLGLENYFDKKTESISLHSNIANKEIRKSLLINVQGNSLHARESILIDTTFETAICQESISYNVEEKKLLLDGFTIRSDLVFSNKKIKLIDSIYQDQKKEWEQNKEPYNISWKLLYELLKAKPKCMPAHQ